jgi:hypothetical protein
MNSFQYNYGTYIFTKKYRTVGTIYQGCVRFRTGISENSTSGSGKKVWLQSDPIPNTGREHLLKEPIMRNKLLFKMQNRISTVYSYMYSTTPNASQGIFKPQEELDLTYS